MEGLLIRQNGDYIEKVAKNSEELSLIAKDDGLEVMLQSIKPDIVVTVSPGEDSELVEFFYILNGQMIYEEDGKWITLDKGDYFYVKNLKETVYFKTLSEVKMLYFSSQPVFHVLSEEIRDLKEKLEELKKKDLYTHDHDLRLREYSMKIADALKLTKAQMENIYYATLFHDIGKINTPSEILNKPSSLTKEEFEIIKKHSIDGKNMLEKTFLNKVGAIIEQHHERPDGSGYPYGLKGDQICVEARIIAIVDSYDAMTSDRPYRKAMPHEMAINELRRFSGVHYDKEILDIFEGILSGENNDDLKRK